MRIDNCHTNPPLRVHMDSIQVGHPLVCLKDGLCNARKPLAVVSSRESLLSPVAPSHTPSRVRALDLRFLT